MLTRREAMYLLAAAPVALAARASRRDPLAPGAPMSPERLALIEAFRKLAAGVEQGFEARTHKSDWVMPYRLFRPEAAGKLPLVIYLHGSGGLGDDNEKQLGLGNVFGTRVWALPPNQQQFPCYILAPQTDRGWIRYAAEPQADGTARAIPGLGDGNRLVLEIVDSLRHELAIDERRIYVTGQSMGGAGVWNLLAHRPRLSAAAVICCASAQATDPGTVSIETPLWNFHGDADQTVPVSVSRDRMAARRKEGGHPRTTEYAGVGHNVWEWAYTEPELVKWVFAQRRGR
jgi:predicted peptidase